MKASKKFFFEKKKQKTFAPLRAFVAPAGPTPTENQSFFCFFFVHKKEDYSFSNWVA
jgi:hypothetical protein